MAFTLPADNPTNWVNDIGMIEDAATLNAFGAMDNAIKAAILAIVNGATVATVATAEQRTATAYGDLTSITDSVTVTVGASGKALVILDAGIKSPDGTYGGRMGFAVSGANTIAASDAKSTGLRLQASNNDFVYPCNKMILLTGLTAGSTTFKLKYKTLSSGVATEFSDRSITVIPFP